MKRIVSVLLLLFVLSACGAKKVEGPYVPDKIAESHYKMGLAYLDGPQDHMAMAEFEKSLKIDKKNPKVYHAMSTFYLKRSDIPKAEEMIHKAMYLSPDNPEFMTAYGSILAANGEIDDALDVWKKVLLHSSYPTMERVYYNMGYALYDNSRYNEAKIYFKEATRVSRSFMLPYLYLFRIYQIQHNAIEAESILKMALKSNPLFLPIMFELGRFYFENAKYTDAAKQFSQVLELYGDSDYAGKSKIYLNRMGIYNE